MNEKLFSLIKKKEELRQFLLNYKNKFENETGRPLAITKDLNPILNEFNEYKQLKENIRDINAEMKLKESMVK